jgi:branched-chain amino acid transport system substrate-binding protein
VSYRPFLFKNKTNAMMLHKNLFITFLTALMFMTGCNSASHKKTLKENNIIKIGAILPLSGDLAQYGESGKQGMEIALEEFRRDHKDLKCEIIVEDDKGDVKVALSGISKIVESGDVKIIVGAMASGVTLGIAPVINKNKIILISPTSTASAVTDAGDYVFRVCVSDAYEGMSMAEYISVNLRHPKIGVVYVNNDYGIGLKKDFIDSAIANGLQIAVESGYNPMQKDFRSIINKLKYKKVDLIYVIAYKEQLNFFTQCKELNYKPQFTGSTMIEDQDLLGKLGDFLDGTLYTYRSYNPTDNGKTTKYFVDTYKSKYGKVPDFYAASTYDATKLALQTEMTCSAENIDYRSYLYGLKKFNGVTGEIKFDKNGDVQQRFSIKQIRGGKFMVIKK